MFSFDCSISLNFSSLSILANNGIGTIVLYLLESLYLLVLSIIFNCLNISLPVSGKNGCKWIAHILIDSNKL